jgi:hypothetical protein
MMEVQRILNMSNEEMMNLLDISRTSLYRYQKGDSAPQDLPLKKILLLTALCKSPSTLKYIKDVFNEGTYSREEVLQWLNIVLYIGSLKYPNLEENDIPSVLSMKDILHGGAIALLSRVAWEFQLD